MEPFNFDDPKAQQQSQARIRWRDTDEEAAQNPPFSRRHPQHSADSDSISIRSWRSWSERRTVDPSTTLPIQYRTVSFDISEAKGKNLAQPHLAQPVKAEGSTTDELAELDWHTISVEEIFQRLSTTPNQGLSPEQIDRKIKEYGKNVPSPPETYRIKQIFGYCFKGFGSVLLTGAILVFIAWKPLGQPPAVANLALAIVLVAVFFIQAAFNAWQDWSSSRVMASIMNMLPENSTIIRGGQLETVLAPEIVPGDVLLIKAGNKLPADVRFVEVDDGRFDRSILTGESLPIGGSVNSTNVNYLETRCIGLQGTYCVSGSAVGVVVATGDKTVFGRIAKLTNKPKGGLTTLEREVLRFVIIIVSIMATMIIVVIILWASWLRRDHPDWINVPTLIVDCVSVGVAFIPEGLPIALTASLTITANLMRKNKILCKSLKTVETLGAVSVLCSDKTGTLTKNEMTVTDCLIGTWQTTPEATRDLMAHQVGSISGGSSSPINQLRAIAGLCNSGEFDPSQANVPLKDRKVIGDATDQSILRFAESLGPVSELRNFWKKHFEIAFNSKNKFMVRVFSLAERTGLSLALSAKEISDWNDGDMLLTIKGAPDVLMKYCTFYTGEDGETHVIDPSMQNQLEKIKNEWSSQGKRVITLARRVVPQKLLQSTSLSIQFEEEMTGLAKQNLTLVGLVAILDPPRDEILEVVGTLRRAGIRIFMVTGDFALTAQAIATECGIVTNRPEAVDNIDALESKSELAVVSKYKSTKAEHRGLKDSYNSIVVSGTDLITLDSAKWDQLCAYDEIVFARTTPDQKLRIVRELQSRSEVVGMTGDGVNDAPSLKAADIGIAVASGSDIAIEASDMILLDSLAGMVIAVRYGRAIFDNLKKTIAYLLPAGSFSEFWPVMTNVLFGLPQVLSSFLMIIICCFTDCAAATVLCYEKPEADVMLRKPRDTNKDRLVDWQLMLQSYGFVGLIECLSSFAMSYWYLQRNGIPFSTLWFGFGAVPTGITADDFAARLAEASSIYFVNLVVMQWFNLMALRTRRLSIFQHPPCFGKDKTTSNWALFPAIVFALVVAVFWLYVPKLQQTLDTSRVPAEHFFLPAAFGLGMLLLDEGRKYCVRRWPGGLADRLAW